MSGSSVGNELRSITVSACFMVVPVEVAMLPAERRKVLNSSSFLVVFLSLMKPITPTGTSSAAIMTRIQPMGTPARLSTAAPANASGPSMRIKLRARRCSAEPSDALTVIISCGAERQIIHAPKAAMTTPVPISMVMTLESIE